MEEYVLTGEHDVASSDLELVQESTSNPDSKQIVGLRFASVNVPPGAIVLSAYIQFTYDNSKTLDPCILNIWAETAPNPQTFTDNLNFELANRPKFPTMLNGRCPVGLAAAQARAARHNVRPISPPWYNRLSTRVDGRRATPWPFM
jgi:hypothetical protein